MGQRLVVIGDRIVVDGDARPARELDGWQLPQPAE